MKLPAGFSGNYNDLTNKPTLFSGSYNDLNDKPTLFSGSYSDLTNKPTIPTVPTNVGAFTNDAGYLTSYTETQTLAEVAANGNAVNRQIKSVSNPTDPQDAVNKQTVDAIVAALTHRYDSIIEYQRRVIDTLRSSVVAPVGGFDENGASHAVFSVSATKKVRFSKGNLQYTTTGTHSVATGGYASGTWRFAENQWEIIGTGNNNISSTYTGWIDLFGWGTSGWNSGVSAYQPYSTSGTFINDSLRGSHVNADWGVYNAISNGGNTPGMWRTLTVDEWYYLLFTRAVSYLRYLMVKVNGVEGIIIFPDEYNHSSKLPWFNPSEDASGIRQYTNNQISAQQFTYLEEVGCVFLPLAKYREGTAVSTYHSSTSSRNATNNNFIHGIYWGSTNHRWSSTHFALILTSPPSTYGSYLSEVAVITTLTYCNTSILPSFGCAVRLVQDVE